MKVRIEVEEPGGHVHRVEFDLVDICRVQLPCAAELTRAMEAKEMVEVGFRGLVKSVRAETHHLQVFGTPPPERVP